MKKMKTTEIAAEDIAFVIEGIIYGEGDGFEDLNELEIDSLESFATKLRESNKIFKIALAK